jgi:hypothetical protein
MSRDARDRVKIMSMWMGTRATVSAWGSAVIPSDGSPWIRRGVMVFLACSALAAAAWVGAALLGISAWHHLYFDRRNVPDLEAFTRFEFPTIGHVYDTNGQPLIELARESRQITQYSDIPPIVRDAILATEDKHFFSHHGVDYLGSVGGLMHNTRELAATVVGAVIGGVAGFLFFTERGRTARRQIETALEDFLRELIGFRNTVQKAAGVVNEGWNLLNDTFGERGKPPRRYSSGQTSAFGGHAYAR